ncbi:lysozyme inhibitor LprI family protein [Pseudomonas helvetica]
MPPRFLLALAPLLLAPFAHADDCANAADQRTMSECAAKDYKKADTQLNALYKQINDRLKDNLESKKLLVGAQRAWVAFRDAECEFSASGVAGGSVYPMIYSNCLAGLTLKRVEAFKTYLECQEGDLSCPVPGV